MSNRLAEFRKKANKKQREAAEALGVSVSQYCKMEKGTRKVSIDDALVLARFLGVTLNDIFLPTNMTQRHQGVKSRATHDYGPAKKTKGVADRIG